ncbi:MAG: hypothetical protein M1834_009063 [Cirrosporium novae-zelandiae]|nr:MAG: hypothetical protein M1834_009063 [Cirrosporium novae-zelandiae]
MSYLLPPASLLSALLLTASTLAFTPPTAIPLRYPAFLALSFLVLIFHTTLTSDAYSPVRNGVWEGVVLSLVWGFVLNAHALLCLERVSWEKAERYNKLGRKKEKVRDESGQNGTRDIMDGAENEEEENEASPWEKFRWGMNLALNPRRLGTPWQIKNVPRFSSKDPGYVPSRSRFLTSRAVHLILLWLFLDTVTSQRVPEEQARYLSYEKQYLFSRWGEVSAEELIVRTVSFITYWFTTVATNMLMHEGFAVLFVGLGISEPKEWPPLFHSLSCWVDTYTLKQLWG